MSRTSSPAPLVGYTRAVEYAEVKVVSGNCKGKRGVVLKNSLKMGSPPSQAAFDKCRAAPECAKIGLCTPEPGNETNCMAGSNKDCRQSRLCTESLQCRADLKAGLCL